MLRVHFLREKFLQLHLGLVLQALPLLFVMDFPLFSAVPSHLPSPFPRFDPLAPTSGGSLAFHTLSQESAQGILYYLLKLSRIPEQPLTALTHEASGLEGGPGGKGLFPRLEKHRHKFYQWAALHWSLDSREPGWASRDNLIWGRDG